MDQSTLDLGIVTYRGSGIMIDSITASGVVHTWRLDILFPCSQDGWRDNTLHDPRAGPLHPLMRQCGWLGVLPMPPGDSLFARNKSTPLIACSQTKGTQLSESEG